MVNPREQSVRVRLYESEKLLLELNAKTHGCTVSQLIRNTAIYGQQLSATIADIKPIQKIHAELRKQGGNLNQLMHSINTHGLHRYDPKEVQQVLDKSNETIEEVYALICDMRKGRLNL